MKSTSFGNYLKSMRLQKALSRAKAAKAAKLSPTRLYEFEVGVSSSTGKATLPNKEQMKRLAAVYEVPLEVMLERAGYLARPRPLDADQERLIDLYLALPLKTRALLLQFLESIL